MVSRWGRHHAAPPDWTSWPRFYTLRTSTIVGVNYIYAQSKPSMCSLDTVPFPVYGDLAGVT
jgi:hypothetical protein